MKMRAWAVTGSAGLFCLVFAMLSFGGAAQVQPPVAKQARDESPLAQTYIVLDRHASSLPTVEHMSRGLADACFSAAYAEIAANPEVGLHLLFTQSRGPLAGLAKACYWGAPILLLISLVLYFTRPRTISLIKT